MHLLWMILVVYFAQPGELKWSNDEQFIEGDSPYYPYNARMYSSPSDVVSLTEEKGFSQESMSPEVEKPRVTGLRQHPNFHQTEEKILKNKREDNSHISSFYQSLNPAPHPLPKIHREVDAQSRQLFIKNKKKNKGTNVTHGSENVKPQIEKYRNGKSNPRLYPRCSGTGKIYTNVNSTVIKPNELLGNKAKLGDADSKSRIVSKPVQLRMKPQEGEGRFSNPNSVLAKGIADFIKRKDYRWLDFMKNTGLDMKSKVSSDSDESRSNAKRRVRTNDLTQLDEDSKAEESFNSANAKYTFRGDSTKYDSSHLQRNQRIHSSSSDSTIKRLEFSRKVAELSSNTNENPPQKGKGRTKDLKLHIKVYVEDEDDILEQ